MERIQITTLKKALISDLGYVADELREHVETPAVVILTGPMGAGKTSLVKAFCPTLNISSPSYSVVNELGDVAHLDLCRLKGPDELATLELHLYSEGKKYFFVEWGIDYAYSLWKILGEHFTYYELVIEVNKDGNGNPTSRNYSLYSIGQD